MHNDHLPFLFRWRETGASLLTEANGLMEYLGGAQRPLSEKYLFREEDVA